MAEFPQSCPYGHTQADLETILGSRLPEFRRWMNGQTMTSCDGRLWDWFSKGHEPSSCAESPHGPVVYPSDLRQFLSGRGPVDW